MNRIRALAAVLVLASGALLTVPSAARAQGCRGGGGGGRPYGDYCWRGRWGRYGARDPVRSAQEARARLEQYYAGEGVKVGKITERDLYFEAEIDGQKGETVDRVIVDKRSGRIRSVF